MSHPTHKLPGRVVVVGAGIAGLSAVEHLYSCGLKDIILLEAKNRIGGRIHSYNFGGSPGDFVELGAQYLGGLVPSCSTYVIANQIGLKPNTEASDKPIRPPERGYVYKTDGTLLDPKLVAKLNQKISEWWDDPYNTNKETMNESLLEFLHDKVLPEYSLAQHDNIRSFFNYYRNWLRLMLGTSPVDDTVPNAEDTDSGEMFSEATEVVGRLESITDEISKRFDSSCIKLGRAVSSIAWGADMVEVTCSSHQGAESYQADHVIVTIPLGVLKAKHVTMFQPDLPEYKVRAIERIPFGDSGKVFLEYSRPWWSKDRAEIAVAWTDEEFSEEVSVDGWIRRVTHMEPCRNSSTTLLVWVAGEGAAHMETLPDQTVSAELTHLIRRLLGNPSIPYPRRVLKSAWGADPYTRGAYTSKGSSTPRDRKDLARPLVVGDTPRVLFAGEAVDVRYYGYMHGARDTGLRAAATLAEFYNLSPTQDKLLSNL